MLKISQSRKFKKDIKKFKQNARKITNPLLQKEYDALLKKFIDQCNIIDNAHSPEYNGNIDPRTIRDNVMEMSFLREKLNKFLN